MSFKSKRKKKNDTSSLGFHPEASTRYESPGERVSHWDFDDLEDFEMPSYRIDGDLSIAMDLGKVTKSILDKNGIPESDRKLDMKSTGMEVGDDRADRGRAPTNLACAICVQSEVLLMSTSQADTFITNWVSNFCEVTAPIPSMAEGSFHYARRTGNFSNLEFVDTIIQRIVIDVSKSDHSHSSTAVGKASMLGSRGNTPRSEFRQMWHLAGFVQDGCLRTSHSPDPKYLPSIMGGSGAPALFDSAENLYLSVLAYKGGGYDRLYGSATQEVQQCIISLDKGIGSSPVLCNRLRDRQEYLHATYDEKIFVPSKSSIMSFREDTPEPIYRNMGGQLRFSGIENRLVRAKQLLGRRDAEREIEQTFRTRHALFNSTSVVRANDARKSMTSEARRKFAGALNANSAFKNMLDRKATIKDVLEMMNNEEFLTVSSGARAFTMLHAQWLFDGGKGETFTINDLSVSEDMFLRDEVSTEESFRVGGIPLRPIVGMKIKPTVTTNVVGLYQINGTMQDWAENLAQSLRDARRDYGRISHSNLLSIYDANREWVNDDTLLIAKCYHDVELLSGSSVNVILVSGDRRLGNQMANTCKVTVFRVFPDSFVQSYGESYAPDWENIPISDVWSCVPTYLLRHTMPQKMYIDTGSVASAAATYVAEAVGPERKKNLFRKELVSTSSKDGVRTAKYNLTPVEKERRLRVEVLVPNSKDKRYKGPNVDARSRPGTAQTSGAGSWRSVTGI